MRPLGFILVALLWGGSACARLQVLPGSAVDLGSFPAESAPTASFELLNKGDAPLHIAGIESGCACFDPVVYQNAIPPGGRVPLDVFINGSKLNGPFEKQILLQVGPPSPTNAILTIKGNARRALPGAPPLVFAGILPLGQPWNTNLELRVRDDLEARPTLHIDGFPGLGGELLPSQNPHRFLLQLHTPPSNTPLSWQGEAVIRFEGVPKIPPVSIKVSGCNGGILQPSTTRLRLVRNTAIFTLQRQPPAPAPITCATAGVEIEETPLPTPGKSRIRLLFSKPLLQRLKQGQRIPVRLEAKGFVPANLVVEP